MNRAQLFAFRVSDIERQAITDLAELLRRSQSDAVRFVVTDAARQLRQAETVRLSASHANQRELSYDAG